ncbi:hypothetical protein CPB83DRAFT_900003 [Crepidotus variabilis]|uniref:Uncharacterized protein n=1 Tax=Crepidotus variabilis TaxID=179855 RepID=A0A9P6E3Z2_9AGAR|nr:hypothetical protein CPB83DRAFT_900003 [Crepidotus variabilis]
MWASFFDNNPPILDFIHVPSALAWGRQHAAHEYIRELPRVSVGANPVMSFDWLRLNATKSVKDAWVSEFQKPEYRGRNFLMLASSSSSKSDIQPTHAKLGSWLPSVMDLWTDGDGMDHPASNPLVARLVRCITNHAPIGEYYHRFNIPEPGHLDALNSTPAFLWQVVKFLRDNPLVFGFPQRQGQLAAPDPPREGEG